MTQENKMIVYVNDEPREYRGESIYELLQSMGIDPERHGIAVAVNAEVIPRDEWKNRRINDGDKIEVVHAIAGG